MLATHGRPQPRAFEFGLSDGPVRRDEQFIVPALVTETDDPLALRGSASRARQCFQTSAESAAIPLPLRGRFGAFQAIYGPSAFIAQHRDKTRKRLIFRWWAEEGSNL